MINDGITNLRSKNYDFFVSLYKKLLEPTWDTFSVLGNLCKIFGWSIITNVTSIMFECSKVFGWSVIIFNCFTDFMFFLL